MGSASEVDALTGLVLQANSGNSGAVAAWLGREHAGFGVCFCGGALVFVLGIRVSRQNEVALPPRRSVA
jgi:hypothetical protein